MAGVPSEVNYEMDAEYVASTVVVIYSLRRSATARGIAAVTLIAAAFVLIAAGRDVTAAAFFPFMLASALVLFYFHRQSQRLVEKLTPVILPYAEGVAPMTVMELMPVLNTRSPRNWLSAPDTQTARNWFLAAARTTFQPPEGAVACRNGHYLACPHRRPQAWEDLFTAPPKVETP